MAKLPEPPAVEALAAISPEIKVLAADQEIWRVYFRAGSHPTLWAQFRSYGPTDARFDHHPPPARDHADRGIFYGAEMGPTCLAEVFQATRVIDRRKGSPWLVAFRLARDVSLLDLTGAWPTRAGASMNINSGPRLRARNWSQRIYAAYPAIEGIQYASSMDANLPAFAFYERALSSMPPAPTFHRALDDPLLLSLLQKAALRFGYGLV